MRKPAWLLALLLTPSIAPAQVVDSSACLSRLTPDVMRRVPVSLVAEIPDSLRLLRPHAEALAWSVADHIRGMLGVADEEMREVGGTSWRDIDADARVVVRQNGTFSWHVERSDTTYPGRGYRLLDSALARVASARPLFFPVGAARDDSPFFMLQFRAPVVNRDGTIEPLRARFAIPILAIQRPWEAPVRMVSLGRIEYPREARRLGFQATVILRAVVDTSGRADPNTVQELWPAGKPRFRGQEGEVYDAFVRSARRTLLQTRFEAAEIGGCRIRQTIQQPFDFFFKP